MAWDDLRFVLNVAEEGTLSAAARSLGVNHSTVLRRISAFEEKRGVRLFERTGSGYAMTAESRHLLSRLREIEERIGALDRAFARLGLELDGPVRITTSDSIAAANIARHVASFQAENPRVVVDFNVSNDYADFSRLDADIAIRPGGAPTGELGGQRVCGLMLRVYAAPRYLEQNHAESYGAHRWLGVAPPLTTTMVGDWQKENLPDANIVLRSNSFVGLRDAAETGLGLAMLPCCIGDPSPHLLRAEAFPDTLTAAIWIVTHVEMMASAKVQSIVTWFVQAIREDTDLFEGRAASGQAAAS